MRMGSIFMLLLLFSIFSCCSKDKVDLKTVEHVELSKYLGKWYEIASLPSWFEKKCIANIVANYSWVEDKKSVKVINSCMVKNQKSESSEGRAFVLDTHSFSKLKVTFLKMCSSKGCFGGDYWILDLDPNYQHVIVGTPNRKYLWILARQNKLPADIYTKLVEKAKNMGFNTSLLLTKPQS